MLLRRIVAFVSATNPRFLSIVPLLPPASLLALIIFKNEPLSNSNASSVSTELIAYIFVGLFGYWATDRLVPTIKQYTLRKGISGKDLGKRGTSIADKDVPEALGIAPGTVFLICLMFCMLGYYAHHSQSQLLIVNSALLSICFMLFLGFTDDVLDWPWRYKLVLPTVASLPLLCCYTGGTVVVVPIPLRTLFMVDGEYTLLGSILISMFQKTYMLRWIGIDIDPEANGALLDLGYLYWVYMGMLAVFCTNAINIYAGINGLEAGQSYILACSVLLHNAWEIHNQTESWEHHLFSTMILLSFTGVTMGLLKHNWYPASVFVGDTFCYFAGMTFAVVGILGHFSKTLLLFFIPQVCNFLWSCPQLFKLVPCPRHRLPKFNPETGNLQPSTFECRKEQFRWLKANPDDTECANMTLLNLCLQIFGPMTERDLCVLLLLIQLVSSVLAFLIRYQLAQLVFDG